MGSKIRSGKVSHLRNFEFLAGIRAGISGITFRITGRDTAGVTFGVSFGLTVGLIAGSIFGGIIGEALIGSSSATAWAARTELGLQAEFKMEEDPLTTEKVWLYDPDQINPHRQNWIDARRTELSGLKAVPKPNGKYGVTASRVMTLVQGYVRGFGPWYSTDSEGQSAQVNAREEAKKAAASAGRRWIDLLKENRVQLEVQLQKITSDTEAIALSRGNEVFKGWLKKIEGEWRSKSSPHQKPESLDWKKRMEPPAVASSVTEKPTSILARAPGKIWDGLFSIRATFRVAGKSLNGRFLVDSGLKKSVFSPVWIENQGIYSIWVEVPGAAPVSVAESSLWKDRRNLARQGMMDAVEIAGLDVSMPSLLLLDSDFFGPPENVGTCCDGVFGKDLLRKFPVEFVSGIPAEMRVWPKEGFRQKDDYSWIEVSENSQGEFVSSCQWVEPETKKRAESEPKTKARNVVLRWNTGLSDSTSLGQVGGKAKIECNGVTVVDGIRGPGASAPSRIDIGMPLLLRSKSVTFDIPHGRLWFAPGLPVAATDRANLTGVQLKYIMKAGERVLVVSQIKRNSPAEALFKAGLRPGMTITQVDSLQAEDMDQWVMERHLRGEYGSTVSLQWKTRGGLKMAPVNVGP